MRCIIKNFNSLPTLKIHIGNEIYAIDQDVYFQRCVKGNNGGGDLCDIYIESMRGGSSILLGDGFFNRYYTMFDL